jgi:hypothetical protein
MRKAGAHLCLSFVTHFVIYFFHARHSPASLQLGYDPPKFAIEGNRRDVVALLRSVGAAERGAAMHKHQTRFLMPCGSIFTSASFPQDDPLPQTRRCTPLSASSHHEMRSACRCHCLTTSHRSSCIRCFNFSCRVLQFLCSVEFLTPSRFLGFRIVPCLLTNM